MGVQPKPQPDVVLSRATVMLTHTNFAAWSVQDVV